MDTNTNSSRTEEEESIELVLYIYILRANLLIYCKIAPMPDKFLATDSFSHSSSLHTVYYAA